MCPYNIKFAQAVRVPAFAPREMLSGKDARHLARELLEMTQEEFSGSFKNSPMKRAKLRGLKRNAAVVLGNVGTAEDLNALTRALEDDHLHLLGVHPAAVYGDACQGGVELAQINAVCWTSTAFRFSAR